MSKAAKLLCQGYVGTIVADSCLEVRAVGFLHGRVAGPVEVGQTLRLLCTPDVRVHAELENMCMPSLGGVWPGASLVS